MQYLKPNAELEVDPHKNMTLEEKLALKASDLVPQLPSTDYRKRDAKTLDKERQRDRLRELEFEKNKYEVS